MMSRKNFLLHPVFVFIVCILAMAGSFSLYIAWYVNIDPMSFHFKSALGLIVVSFILMSIVITGISIIFVYHQKVLQLYRKQENFINNFTHELKTPIASIKLILDTFKKHELTENEQEEFLVCMQKDADRLSSNVHQILLLAHLENKKDVFEFHEIEIQNYIDQFLKDNSYLFSTGEISFQHYSSSLYIPVNRELMDMAIMNILTNAFKYCQDRPQIEISVHQTPRNIEIHFKDNGIGLKKADFKNVFTKFYQVQKKEGFKNKSSGLGLYLSQEILKKHKGKIVATSPGLGKGSTFTFILPNQISNYIRPLKARMAT